MADLNIPPHLGYGKTSDISRSTPIAVNIPPASSGSLAQNENMFGKDGFKFDDFLDIINPLQNLPIIGSLYRNYSGDETNHGSRLAGGMVYGGPFGLLGAMADIATEEMTGKDIGGNLIAGLGVEEGTEATIKEASQPITPSLTSSSAQADKLAQANATFEEKARMDTLAAAARLAEYVRQQTAKSSIKIDNLPPITQANQSVIRPDADALALLKAFPAPTTLSAPATLEAAAPQRLNGHLSANSVAYLEALAKSAMQASTLAPQVSTALPPSDTPNLKPSTTNNPFSPSILSPAFNLPKVSSYDPSHYLTHNQDNNPEYLMNQALNKYETIQRMAYQNGNIDPTPMMQING